MTRLVDLTLQKLHETDRAVLVTDSGPESAVWLAKSLIEIEPNAENAGLVDVTLPLWLAEERGLV